MQPIPGFGYSTDTQNNPFGAVGQLGAQPGFRAPAMTGPGFKPNPNPTPSTQAAVAAVPNYRGATLAAFDRSGELLNQREGDAYRNLDAGYTGQRNTLSSNRVTGMENLARQKETTTRQKNTSIRDLSNNIRNAYQGGINKLGAMGASDSSASKMYGYALGQQEGQNNAAIVGDYNYNLGNIDISERQLQRDYDNKISSLDVWKAGEAFKIRDTFLQSRDALNQQRAQLGGAAVSQAQSALATQAANSLANVSAQATSAAGIIQNDFAKAAASLRQYAQANANPNVSMETGYMNQNVALQDANPTLYRKYNEL